MSNVLRSSTASIEGILIENALDVSNLSIDKADQAHVVVAHGVARHERYRKVKKDGRKAQDVTKTKDERWRRMKQKKMGEK